MAKLIKVNGTLKWLKIGVVVAGLVAGGAIAYESLRGQVGRNTADITTKSDKDMCAQQYEHLHEGQLEMKMMLQQLIKDSRR